MKLSRLFLFSHLSHCAAVGVLAALCACGSQSSGNSGFGHFNIVPSDDTSEFDKYVESVDYVLLKESPDHMIAYPDMLVHSGNKFYALESFMRPQILAFDENGNFLHTIGRRGNGPGEYSRPSKIYVIGDNLYAFDAMGGAKLFRYTTDGEFIDVINQFPNKIQTVKPLNDSTYMVTFRGSEAGNQYAIVNAKGEIIHDGIPFATEYAGDYSNPYSLRALSNGNTLIHQPLTGVITAVTPGGDVAGEYTFEFVGRQVPADKYKSFEEMCLGNGRELYATFSGTPIIENNVIIGNASDRKHNATVIGDVTSGEVKSFDITEIELTPKTIVLPQTVDNGTLYSTVFSDVYEGAMESAWLPDSVKTHLEAGNKVIIKYKLK